MEGLEEREGKKILYWIFGVFIHILLLETGSVPIIYDAVSLVLTSLLLAPVVLPGMVYLNMDKNVMVMRL